MIHCQRCQNQSFKSPHVRLNCSMFQHLFRERVNDVQLINKREPPETCCSSLSLFRDVWLLPSRVKPLFYVCLSSFDPFLRIKVHQPAMGRKNRAKSNALIIIFYFSMNHLLFPSLSPFTSKRNQFNISLHELNGNSNRSISEHDGWKIHVN